MFLQTEEVKKQSENAWIAWRSKWIRHCKVNKDIKSLKVKDLVDKGKGRIIVICAFGNSLNKNIELLKLYRDDIDIMCCDKAFGYLMENGIVPDYCLIADASVDTSWIKGQDTSRTALISNIAASTEWTTNWKGSVYFYVNWDNIDSAFILGKIGNCFEAIPASSNVSNAMVVFASQVFGHKAILLLGYDYSWREGGLYYASQDSPKRDYLHHLDLISPYGYIAQTSSNLTFSCKWLMQFLFKFFKVNAINCSQEGILDLPRAMPLEKAIRLNLN